MSSQKQFYKLVKLHPTKESCKKEQSARVGVVLLPAVQVHGGTGAGLCRASPMTHDGLTTISC